MSVITPFTDTLQDGSYLIDYVYVMFLFDLILTPVLYILDIFGNLSRHYFGPRATCQRRMNLCFKAGQYDIGQMYTNVTRILFFTLFYSTIFPLGYFFAFAIFTIAHLMEKFCILRSWGQSPQVNASVSKLTNIFFVICLMFFAIMSAYNYAQFPFDSVCETEYSADDYVGTWTLTLFDDSESSVEVTENDSIYESCGQNLMHNLVYPPTAASQPDSTKWMNASQETFSTMYGWTMILITVSVIVTVIYWTLSKSIRSLFCRGYQPVGEPTPDRFSDVPSINGYIPQVKVPGYQFPFLVCDIDTINEGLMGWKDPYNSYDFWNLIYDIPEVAEKKRQERILHADEAYVGDEGLAKDISQKIKYDGQIFSIVQDWDTSHQS
mmetsp:Transcript_8946/g.9816  ORF Transcript_8946/g.9816 Transcript_8946/m.9816 type:complete len:380 (-) Transcript_8946:176-1315(-)